MDPKSRRSTPESLLGVLLLFFILSGLSLGAGNPRRVVLDCGAELSFSGRPSNNPRLMVWRHTSDSPRARLLIIHGMKEHSAWHAVTAESLKKQGIEVIRFDLRGAGKSEGTPQYVKKFGDYVDDVRDVVAWIQQSLPSLPLFILGHSMGGTIALKYAAENPSDMAGLILSAPAYLPGRGIVQAKILLARLLSAIAPKARIRGALAHNGLTKNDSFEQTKRADPLVYRFNTARQGMELYRTTKEIPALATAIRMPVLIVHGGRDFLVKPQGSNKIFSLLPSNDKTIHIFPDGMHELHHDTEQEEVFALMQEWIRQRVK